MRTASLFEGDRLTLEDAINLSIASLTEYGRRYRHWAGAYSGGKDSTAAITLAALTSVVATVLAYLAVYGPTLAGLPAFTRVFGRVFDGSMTLILVLKTLAFGLAVAVIPLASALQERGERAAGLPADFASREAQALQGLVRLFAVLLLLEALSLVGNYY